MSQGLNKLKTLGAQKIHEDTHIALRYVQSVIHESFEGLTKVQFLGFVSILEREYEVDLSELKKKGVEYFKEENESTSKVFVVPEKKTNFTTLYIIIVIMIFSLAIYASFNFAQASKETKVLDNHAILDAQKKIANKTKIDVLDSNKSDENLSHTISESNTSVTTIETNSSNATKTDDVVVEKKEPVVVHVVVPPKEKVVKKLSPLVIKPRKRVWIGWINARNHKKTQTVVKKILTLDGGKEWLIVTGHGNINITLNGKTTKYSSPTSVRYLYKNGSLKKLSIKEFRKLNNGRLW